MHEGAQMSPARLPLQGVTVLELGSRIAAVFCTSILSEQGATVIKIEDPTHGDMLRIGNPFVGSPSLFFSVEDRNRKGITLNLRHPTGQQLLRELALRADVLCENFRPGTMEQWELGPADLNPRLIYARISAFGQDGPYSSRPGLDLLGISYGGLLHLTGHSDRPPVKSTVTIADHLTGAFVAQAVTAALYRRRVSPSASGEVIDASLYGSILRTLEATLAEFTLTGVAPDRARARPFEGAPAGIFETLDGKWIAISGGSDFAFGNLSRLMGIQSWLNSPQYASIAARRENATILNGEVGAWACVRVSDELIELCRSSGVPVSRVNSPLDLLDDPHIAARNDLPEFSDHMVGPLRQPAPYPRFSRFTSPVEGAPTLGEHNREVWCDRMGISDARFESLVSEGVI